MIEVIKTMPLNSVQDLGRPGYRDWGITQAGALDTLAVMGGNALLGNSQYDAVLEIQMFPVTLKFTQKTLFAVVGADCQACLNDAPLPSWWAREAQEGDTLTLLPPVIGARCYLAVQGGITVPEVLGSRSTALRYGFGGYMGRSIQKGDCLPIAVSRSQSRIAAGYGACPPSEALDGETAGNDMSITLRVMPASEFDMFTQESKDNFLNGVWRVGTQSDRMGYRLSGPVLERTVAYEMRSHAIVPGVIQVPPSGQPIIQLADGNSAGGYPKIGFVIDADLWRIAQARPGTALHFQMCDLARAKAAQAQLIDYLAELRDLSAYCRVPFEE